MKTLLLILLVTVHCYPQQQPTIPAYRPRTINQKNIAKININTEGLESYTYLSKEKDFIKELNNYLKSILPNLQAIQKTNIIQANNNYYLTTTTANQTINTLLHKVMVRDLPNPYLIMGTNHCIVFNNTKLCYPSEDGMNCIDQQENCQKLITKNRELD